MSRIGGAIDPGLLAQFDRFIGSQGYENRSEAFRDLIGHRLVAAAAESPDGPVVGTITLIYDHHSRLLPDKLMGLQRDNHDLIIATTHAHLDHDTCLEVVVVKRQIQSRAEAGRFDDQHQRCAPRTPGDERPQELSLKLLIGTGTERLPTLIRL